MGGGRAWRLDCIQIRDVHCISYNLLSLRLYLKNWLVGYPQDFYRRALNDSFTTTTKKNKLYLR